MSPSSRTTRSSSRLNAKRAESSSSPIDDQPPAVDSAENDNENNNTPRLTKVQPLQAKKKAPTSKRKTAKRKKKSAESSSDDESKGNPDGDTSEKKIPKRKKTTKKSDEDDQSSNSANKSSPEKKKTTAHKTKINPQGSSPKTKKTKVEPQRLTEKEPLPKLWDAKKASEENGSYIFKILSWNVAGLRAILRNHPDALPNLAKTHDLDMICLQETKLQESHVDDPKLKIRGFLLEEEGYDSYYNCATSKKGYSGTAVFVKRRASKSGDEDPPKEKKKQASMTQFFNKTSSQKDEDAEESSSSKAKTTSTSDFDTSIFIPKDISYGLDKSKHDTEGRMITLHFPNLFTLSNLYVPNSGQNLDRLSYRTQEWDSDLVEYMDQYAQKTKTPVIWFGDLNVAHGALDTWNEGAKHLAKSAGTTKEERESFEKQLDHGSSEAEGKEENESSADGTFHNNGAYIDAFRYLHPDKGGHYTYWSQRAGNRGPNKGLRLDYFICSKSLMGDNGRVVVRDSYMIPEQMGSDHCPIVLELEIKKE